MTDLRLAAGNTILALNVAVELIAIVLLVASLGAVAQIITFGTFGELVLADQGLRRWNARRKAAA